MPIQRIDGREFLWSVERGVDAYEPLHCYPGPERIDVLRIDETESGFSVAIRIDSGNYSGGVVRHWLGPMLILGCGPISESGSNALGHLLDLRPKIRALGGTEPNACTVERVVQWCLSSNFTERRVNASGGRWVGYGK